MQNASLVKDRYRLAIKVNVRSFSFQAINEFQVLGPAIQQSIPLAFNVILVGKNDHRS
jgi:hypothetical protein